MLRKSIIRAFIALILLAACTPMGTLQIVSGFPLEATKQTLTVFAAASLTEAFRELGRGFEVQFPDVKVILNFAGSQQLAQQIAQGAPADVFASANHIQMEAAIQDGRVFRETAHIFAYNRLLVIYPDDNPAGVRTLADLAKPGLKLGLAAEAVPVGRYSLEFLDKASAETALGPNYSQGVLSNVVSYEQTVKAVFSKVALGEVDAGIVYVSDAWGANSDKVGRLMIPEGLNPLASYTIAPISDSLQGELTDAFIAFVLSHDGQEILAQNGLLPALR